MKLTLASIVGFLAFTGSAMAAEYELKPGSWRVFEGVGVSNQSANQSSKTICVKSGETLASTDWFTDLAKPKTNCNSKVIGETAEKISLEFTCPMGNAMLKGPSTIEMSETTITVRNDLVVDLPYAPLPMGQTKTVQHISNTCSF